VFPTTSENFELFMLCCLKASGSPQKNKSSRNLWEFIVKKSEVSIGENYIFFSFFSSLSFWPQIFLDNDIFSCKIDFEIIAMSFPLHSDEDPPFLKYAGQDSFFGGEAPLSVGIGYAVVLGFGLFFSIVTTIIVYINRYFGKKGNVTSEHFK